MSSKSASSNEADLVSMGFPPARVRTALKEAGSSLEAALQWLVDNAEDDEGDASGSGIESELISMGFEKGRVKAAVRARPDDLEGALQWLMEDGDKEPDPPARPAKKQKAEPVLPAPAPPKPEKKAAEKKQPEPAAPVPKGRAPSAASSSSSSTSTTPMTTAGHTDHRSLKRLMKEYQTLAKFEEQGGCRKLNSFEANPVDPSDLYTWDLHLYDFENDQEISADLKKRKLERVSLRILFPNDYPNSPPFVHMLRPRLKEGTGYVLNGGGICMELLTPSEWSPATSISALVMSVRAMLLVGNARLKTTDAKAKEPDYVYEEARRDFAHIVKIHKERGWTSHPMFKQA